MSDEPFKQLVAKPFIESIRKYYQPPPCNAPDVPIPNPDKEIIALATAVFQGVDPRVYDTHRVLVAQLAVDYGPNLWIIPIHERMTFPDAPLFSVAAMMNMEDVVGKRADWFFWVEDDICVPKDIVRKLRAAADPEERPFVAAIGYDRNPPFPIAVWDFREGGNLEQWTSIPDQEVVQAGATGLTAALIHRSVFDRVKEPYFASGSAMLTMGHKDNQIQRGIKPDAWWSCRLKDAGIPTFIHTGINVTHLGARIPVNRETVTFLRSEFGRKDAERRFRGGNLQSKPNERVDSPVHADIRQGVPEGVGGTHGVDGELGEEILT